MHDPVTPTILKPAIIGWEAKERDVELTIERAFTGEELVKRMKGWVTVDVKKAIETVNRFGRFKVLDERELVVELENDSDYDKLSKALSDQFGDQLNMDRL
jgi:hypothetical protein